MTVLAVIPRGLEGWAGAVLCFLTKRPGSMRDGECARMRALRSQLANFGAIHTGSVPLPQGATP